MTRSGRSVAVAVINAVVKMNADRCMALIKVPDHAGDCGQRLERNFSTAQVRRSLEVVETKVFLLEEVGQGVARGVALHTPKLESSTTRKGPVSTAADYLRWSEYTAFPSRIRGIRLFGNTAVNRISHTAEKYLICFGFQLRFQLNVLGPSSAMESEAVEALPFPECLIVGVGVETDNPSHPTDAKHEDGQEGSYLIPISVATEAVESLFPSLQHEPTSDIRSKLGDPVKTIRLMKRDPERAPTSGLSGGESTSSVGSKRGRNDVTPSEYREGSTPKLTLRATKVGSETNRTLSADLKVRSQQYAVALSPGTSSEPSSDPAYLYFTISAPCPFASLLNFRFTIAEAARVGYRAKRTKAPNNAVLNKFFSPWGENTKKFKPPGDEELEKVDLDSISVVVNGRPPLVLESGSSLLICPR